MKRLLWLTDLHLDFVDDDGEIATFLERISGPGVDAVLIGGDIGIATTLDHHLGLIERCLQRPVYFVLGNHDFYGGRIAEVRRGVSDLCRRSTWLNWLPDAGIVDLSDETCLVGHDSWADGRLGLGSSSSMMLNDYFCIEDFQGQPHEG